MEEEDEPAGDQGGVQEGEDLDNVAAAHAEAADLAQHWAWLEEQGLEQADFVADDDFWAQLHDVDDEAAGPQQHVLR